METLAAAQGHTTVTGKITSDFSYFLGKVDSQAVVTGLRNGQWTYATPDSTGTGTTTMTTVALPTGKMGYGNAYISLAIAKQQLSHYGITQPTEAELQAALTGGTITTMNGTTANSAELKGNLTMRSEGMGWGEIAKEAGYKNLGSIVSAMKSANHNISVAKPPSKVAETGIGQTAGASKSGIVSSGGNSQGNSAQAGLGKNNPGQGIVTGSGRAAAGVGHASGQGEAGIVTGSGRTVGANGITSAGGQGQGQAKGLNR